MCMPVCVCVCVCVHEGMRVCVHFCILGSDPSVVPVDGDSETKHNPYTFLHILNGTPFIVYF